MRSPTKFVAGAAAGVFALGRGRRLDGARHSQSAQAADKRGAPQRAGRGGAAGPDTARHGA